MTLDFKALGKPMNKPSKDLERFPAPARVTEVRFTSDELTSFCPVTGQPHFSHVEIVYAPDQWCVESKSLKLYLWTFREEPLFGEQLAHTLVEDIYAALAPWRCRVTLTQHVRGGLQLTAVAERSRE